MNENKLTTKEIIDAITEGIAEGGIWMGKTIFRLLIFMTVFYFTSQSINQIRNTFTNICMVLFWIYVLFDFVFRIDLGWEVKRIKEAIKK